MAALKDFIHGLPKAELHCHLEGTLTTSLATTIAERNNLPVPPSPEPAPGSAFPFNDLSSFLAMYYSRMSILLTEADFHDLAYTHLSRLASQNTLHAELFFDPQAHTSRSVPLTTVLSGLSSGLALARKDHGISCSLILCILRDHSVDSAEATLTAALPYRDQFIGFGLDSDEAGNPPRKFANVFARARAEGLHLTMHADVDQKNSIEHIRQALEEIKVDRLDHGTNIVEDARLVALVKEKGLGMTCCPVSNSVINPADFKGKEMVSLMRAGVKTTVCSDDPAYFGAELDGNLEYLCRGLEATKIKTFGVETEEGLEGSQERIW